MSKKERRRTRISGSVDKLPEGIRLQLDAKLMDTSNSYTDLALWLKEEGYPVSRSAIGRCRRSAPTRQHRG